MPAVQKSMNDLEEMAKEVFIFYQEAHKDVVFEFKCPSPPPRFSFDPKQLKRALINLMDNALDAIPRENGKIEVRLIYRKKENAAFLVVADNGVGVPDEDKLRMFEPYFSTKKSGTGLGLAISSTIVADHDGYIRVKDNEPTGSRFVIELPVVMG